MNQPDYCAWPPRMAADVEISSRADADRQWFIAGSASVGRYLILGAAERHVIGLLDGAHTLEELTPVSQHETLTRFLAKLDEVGMLAGERAGRPMQALLPGNQVYLRWSLFNPDHLFARVLPVLRWIWTPWFFAASLLLFAGTAAMSLMNWAEVSRYAGQVLREHYLLIFLLAWLVTICHEFAHGLTSKAFGGRATEIGFLLIYYCLPALYCNVSGLHLIPRRGQRLWVIGAGVYWQLLVGASALAAWFVLNPDTLLGRLAMAFVLASLLDVVFNANPLIKLDGYYFLSQWLGVPNLMDRSRLYWRGETARFSRRERRIFLVYGLFSFLYNLALPVAIVWYAACYLMDRFYFTGLLLSLLLALIYAWRPLKKMMGRRGGDMTLTEQEARRLRRFIPAAIGLCCVVTLCLPWKASVGSYGTLMAIPGREAIIRAPDNGSLIGLNIQPGQHVAHGLTIGRMGNLDLEERIVEVRSELARVNTDIERLSGEMRVQQDMTERSEWQLAQRQREFEDMDAEEKQIRARLHAAPAVVLASYPASSPRSFPAALAALEAEAEQLASRLAEAEGQRERARKLFAAGLIARNLLEADETRSSVLTFNLQAAKERLHAAVIEHGRRQTSTHTAVSVARSDVAAARAQAGSLSLQVDASRRLADSLGERLALLERKRAEFVLVTTVTGTVFGADLPRMTGQYFAKGAEICRIAGTHELLVRAQVAEQAVGDISVGYPVRVKTRAFPDRVFRGMVSKIGGESELDANGQRTYRVELTIQNEAGLLRPGMTVFARVDFGRRLVGWLLAHKLKQSLRPEMWML